MLLEPADDVREPFNIKGAIATVNVPNVNASPAIPPAKTAPTLVASQLEAQKEAQKGIQDGDEPLVGNTLNKLA